MLPALSEPVALPPGSAVRIARVSQSANDPVPDRFLHFHGPAEIVLIHEGSGSLLSETATLPFSAGTLLYVPSMAAHDFAFERDARSWTLIQFDPVAVDQQAVALPAIASAGHLDADSDKRTIPLLDWLGTCLDRGAPERETTVVLHALLLSLKALLREAAATEMPLQLQPSPFRPLMERWVHEPHRVFNLAEAASLCSLSPAYFSRQFRRALGRGFIAYQTQLRLQQAARMIASSDQPISRIAYDYGFQSPAYFARCYKAEFGVAPSTHRKAALARRFG